MKKYLYLAGLILSVSQANAFRVEYRTPTNGSTSGNIWSVDVYATDSNGKQLYSTAKRANLNSCIDHGSSCPDPKSPSNLNFTIYIRESNVRYSYTNIGQKDSFTAPCNALVTYVYDSNTQIIYRTVEKIVQKAWKLNGTRFVEDSTNNGKSLTDIYPDSGDYWDQKPVITCPNTNSSFTIQKLGA